MIHTILDMAFVASTFWAIYFGLKLRKERKEWAEKWANRPVGHVDKIDNREDGVYISGRIWDPELTRKMTGALGGYSIAPDVKFKLPEDGAPIRFYKDKE